MPAARVVVNTPSTHGAIGFSTALPPSMTLGCGSWGGNVTSDNISPLHLMDIKRVAFETRPVTVTAEPPVQSLPAQSPQPPQASLSDQPQINSREREVIAALVDKFVAARRQPPSSAEALNADLREPAAATNNQPQASPPVSPMSVDKSESNGHRPVDFVCEDDVRRAVAAGEKIYVNAKTIITPAARELGEQREVFAKTG
jgi:acetaldehyde dehydrogenase (acetylating)